MFTSSSYLNIPSKIKHFLLLASFLSVFLSYFFSISLSSPPLPSIWHEMLPFETMPIKAMKSSESELLKKANQVLIFLSFLLGSGVDWYLICKHLFPGFLFSFQHWNVLPLLCIVRELPSTHFIHTKWKEWLSCGLKFQ